MRVVAPFSVALASTLALPGSTLAAGPAGGARPVVTPPGLAAPAADIDDQKKAVDESIDDLRETLSGTSKELLDAYTRLVTAQGELRKAQQALSAAKAVEAKARKKDAELATRLAAAETAQARAQAELAQGQLALTETQESMGQFASQVYRDNGVSPELRLILGSQSPDEFASRNAMVDYVLRFQKGSIRTLEQQRASNATVQDRLDAVQAQIAKLKEEAAANLKVAQAARAEAARQQAAVAAAVRTQTAAVNAIRARKAEEDARMASLRAQQSQLTAQLKARADAARARAGGPGAPTSIGPTGGLLNNPVPGAPVTSEFGMRIHPIYKYARLHAGMDFGVACGSPVYASADGEVVSVGTAGGYGNLLVLDHGWVNGGGLATAYAHLQSFVVRSGSVKRGQLVAYSGTTGASTGCHLHYEVRVNGTPVNPRGYL